MSRYIDPSGSEAEYQPGSRKRVLRNLQGITSKRDIDQLEFKLLVKVQEKYYSVIEDSTRFTAELICQMHKDWLGSLYEWAGKYRTVELSKAGFCWPPAYLTEKNMTVFEKDFLYRLTPCKKGSIPKVSEILAEVHSELLFVHPFRDGNGRLARWLTDLLSLQAGLPLPEYSLTGRGSVERRKQYISAVQNGYLQNYQPLANFFEEALERAML